MLLGVELWVLLLILGTALVSGVIHGAVGLAGGLLMATVISHFMPIQAAVTVVTSALLFRQLVANFFYLAAVGEVRGRCAVILAARRESRGTKATTLVTR